MPKKQLRIHAWNQLRKKLISLCIFRSHYPFLLLMVVFSCQWQGTRACNKTKFPFNFWNGNRSGWQAGTREEQGHDLRVFIIPGTTHCSFWVCNLTVCFTSVIYPVIYLVYIKWICIILCVLKRSSERVLCNISTLNVLPYVCFKCCGFMISLFCFIRKLSWWYYHVFVTIVSFQPHRWYTLFAVGTRWCNWLDSIFK
jgi:hypothetical protein